MDSKIQELFDIIVDTGYDTNKLNKNNFEKCIKNGFDSEEFRKVVQFICSEIHLFGNTEEKVELRPELTDFKFEISSLLNELSCPHDKILTVPLENRFQTINDRILLLEFLLTELMTLKMCFSLKTQENQNTNNVSKTALALSSITTELDIGKLSEPSNSKILFDKICSKLSSSIKNTDPAKLSTSLLKNHPKLTDLQWNQLQAICNDLVNEYSIRRRMLLTRLDVTINSFQWSDKFKNSEDKIINKYQEKLKEFELNVESENKKCDLALLLAARNDLAIIDNTKSALEKKKTICKLQKHIIGMVPDRGGRTNEHMPPPPEMPAWQKRVAPAPGRGRGQHNNYSGQRQYNNSGQGQQNQNNSGQFYNNPGNSNYSNNYQQQRHNQRGKGRGGWTQQRIVNDTNYDANNSNRNNTNNTYQENPVYNRGGYNRRY